MTGDNNAICGEVKTTTAFVVIGKAKDTLRRARCELMGHGGRKIRITMAPKDTEMIICGWCTKKSLMGSAVLKGFGGVKIK
jgi:hypothetical protein